MLSNRSTSGPRRSLFPAQQSIALYALYRLSRFAIPWITEQKGAPAWGSAALGIGTLDWQLDALPCLPLDTDRGRNRTEGVAGWGDNCASYPGSRVD